MNTDETPAGPSGREKRTHERVALHVPGQLFDPKTAATAPCRVLSLSPGGAGIVCAVQPSTGASAVLYVEGFGRFEGTVVAHGESEEATEQSFGLAFSLNPAKRTRVKDMLALFVREGLHGLTQLRQARRFRTNGSIEVVFLDGQKCVCELLDISLDGVSLRTTVRPPLGTIVALGRARGEVARHHEYGIALRFLRDASQAA
jgi:hypothetical protein